MSLKQIIFGFTAVGAVIVGGVIGYRYFSTSGIPLDSHTSSNAAKPVAVAFTNGEEQNFALHMKSAVTLHGQLNNKQNTDMSVEVTGIMHLLTLNATSATARGQRDLLVRISDLNLNFIQGGKVATGADLPATARGVSGGMIISYGAEGTIQAFRPQADLDRFAEQILRQAASGLQFSLAGSGLSSEWTEHEVDGTGSYDATYHIVADARDASGATTALMLDKEKSGYTAMTASTSGAGMRISGKVTGHFTGRIDESSGWPHDVTGSEELTIALGQTGSMTSEATTSYTYRYLGKQQLTPDAVARLRRNVTHLAAGVTPAQHHAALLKSYALERLGSARLSDLKKQEERLADMDRAQRSNAERAVFDKTVAYVRLHADNLQELQASLNGRKAGDPWLLNTLNALSHVGCASCQSVLLQEVMSRSGDPNFATTLVSLLSQPQVPSLAVEQALRTLAASTDPDTKMVADLSLGTVANKLSGVDNLRSEAIVGDYLSQFQQATAGDRMTSLAVLGNSGSPLIIPAVGTLLTDPSDRVRTAAVQALRNVPAPEAAATLGKMLTDPSAEVRLAVVSAFGQQPTRAATGEVLADQLANESSPLVRGAIVEQLSVYYQSVPTARAAVDRVANADPDVNLRVLAKNTAIMNSAAH